MIVKGIRQVRSSKRGINLSISSVKILGNMAGLYGTRYNGYFNDDVYWFSTAVKHGDINQLNSIVFSSSPNFDTTADQYSWEWLGYFKPNTTEIYTFYTDSDDASYLWIGDIAKNGFNPSNAIVNNGGLHGQQEVSGSISLTAGKYYPIRIQFGENFGGDIIIVSFSSPSIAKRNDGLGFYFYNKNTNSF